MSDAVIIAIIGAFVSVLTLVCTGFVAIQIAKISKQQDVIHTQINGHQETLLRLTEKSAKAEGKLEGQQEEADRQTNLTTT